MYTTPSTTAGEEKSTNLPSCVLNATWRFGTFDWLSVVSEGFSPVCAWLNRNCGQFTVPVPEAEAGEATAPSVRHTAARATRRLVFMGLTPFPFGSRAWPACLLGIRANGRGGCRPAYRP